MRLHYNPNKDLPITPETFWHQVIIPIYIPKLEGYYSESFEVLKICLESLFKTSHERTYFTCINNGSGDFVKDYLDQLLSEGKIHEVIHTTNIGKINSILKGINGHDFQIITVTDSDVIFLSGWQHECYSMFLAFPKLAALSTTPNPKLYKFHTWNIIKEFVFSKNLRFTPVEEGAGFKEFAASIGNPDLFSESHLKHNLTLTLGGKSGVLGAGHFVVTYRKEIFEDFPLKYTSFKMGGDTEGKLDELASKKGCWRLATTKSYTRHMGNQLEPWMKETLEKMNAENGYLIPVQFPPLHQSSKISVFIANSFVAKILRRSFFLRKFLIYKGLPKKFSSNY